MTIDTQKRIFTPKRGYPVPKMVALITLRKQAYSNILKYLPKKK